MALFYDSVYTSFPGRVVGQHPQLHHRDHAQCLLCPGRRSYYSLAQPQNSGTSEGHYHLSASYPRSESRWVSSGYIAACAHWSTLHGSCACAAACPVCSVAGSPLLSLVLSPCDRNLCDSGTVHPGSSTGGMGGDADRGCF